jgi:hypothetical protein
LDADLQSASVLLLTWLVAPLIAIGLLAGLLAFVGSVAALCSSIVRMLRPTTPDRAPAPEFAPVLPEPRRCEGLQGNSGRRAKKSSSESLSLKL